MPIASTLADIAVDIATLKPYGGNPRRGNLAAIKESLEVNGQYRPIVVRKETGEVLAGNHTLAAAKALGWKQIAATWVSCTDAEAARIVLVDNRSNDLAGYDEEALAAILTDLDGQHEGTGFTDAAVQAILEGVGVDDPIGLNDPDDVPTLEETPTISAPGDVFDLDGSMVLCGDSTNLEGVADLLDGRRPYTLWTDPPYGVSYVGGTKDALTIQNDGAEGLGELLAGAFTTAAAVLRPGAACYVAHADTERVRFEAAMLGAGLLVRQNLIWVKDALVLGRSDYHYQHEPILAGEAPGDEELADPALGLEDDPDHEPLLYGFTPGPGRLGRGGGRWFGGNKQTTVFQVARPKRNAEHPTMKPVELVRSMLANSTPRGGLVLDLFGGSGTTLIAAWGLGMRAALVELDPRYVDVICRRWQQHTGNVPVRRSTGLPVSFIEGV